MTYEEAKRIINSDIVNYDKLQEARMIAIDCIEKQIPKKPIEQGCLGSKDKYKYGRCPNPLCNIGVNYEMGYCDFCGQRLDWTEDTE